MKITRIRKIRRKNGLTELRKELTEDFKLALLISSMVIPFFFLAFLDAPLIPWLLWFGWIGLVVFANKPAHSYRKSKKKFKHYEIGEDEEDE